MLAQSTCGTTRQMHRGTTWFVCGRSASSTRTARSCRPPMSGIPSGSQIGFEVLRHGMPIVPKIKVVDQHGAICFNAMDVLDPRWHDADATRRIQHDRVDPSESAQRRASRDRGRDRDARLPEADPARQCVPRRCLPSSTTRPKATLPVDFFQGQWRGAVRPMLEWTTRGVVERSRSSASFSSATRTCSWSRRSATLSAFCDEHPRIRPCFDGPDVGHSAASRTGDTTISTYGARITPATRTPSSSRTRGTDTWVFGVDGDELYDPDRLAALRRGTPGWRVRRRLQGRIERCQLRGARAERPPLPPAIRRHRRVRSRSSTTSPQSSHGPATARSGSTAARSSFRPGFDEGSVDNIGERLSWDETPLRCLHLCFVRRSTADPERSRPPARS